MAEFSLRPASCDARPRSSLLPAQEALSMGQTTSAALTASALERMAAPAGEGARTFTRVFADRARHLARASDDSRAAGFVRSPLEGLAVSVKDLLNVSGEVTTAGSRALGDAAPASRDSDVVLRLLAAGAVLVGKTNMSEFAYTGLGINPHFGTPANPWRRSERRIPGGSSSGAAVAIADGMCLASVGTDTGGSARIPAALCGIAGFKPTARRMPSSGMIPLSTSLDSVGLMGGNVGDCATIDAVLTGMQIMTGPALPGGHRRELARARFAVPTTFVQDGLDAEVASAFLGALQCLSSAGAELIELPVPEFDELSAYNAAGGFSAFESWPFHAELIGRRAEMYDPRVLSRIRRGEGLTARDYFKLVASRADWQRRVTDKLMQFDGWLMPTVPQIAPRIESLEAHEQMYFKVNAAMLRNPSVVNFLDGCAISVPCHERGAAPVGLSLASYGMQDHNVLGWAQAIEAAFHEQER